MRTPRLSLCLAAASLLSLTGLALPQIASAEPQAAESVDGLLATADVTAGAKTGKACQTCHSVDKGGATRIGPNLWNIVNRPVGSVAGFHYSTAFKKVTAKTWSYHELNEWLYAPSAEAPGTTMSFAGVKKTQDRANVIAWLRTLSDSPAPLPKAK